MGYIELDHSERTSHEVNGDRRIIAEGVLLHTTAGTDSLDWLMGGSARAGSPASADYLIDRDGTRHRITPAGRFAFHAGKGRLFYRGKVYTGDQVSQVLIGIEIEQNGEQDITREQYASCAELISDLAAVNSWRGDFPILGHYATARPRGRRSDPCNFDFGVLRSLLRGVGVQLPLPYLEGLLS